MNTLMNLLNSDLCEALDTLDEIDYEVDDQDPSCLAVWEK